MQYCRDSGADVIAITDKPDNPIALNSDCALLAPSDMASFVDSLVAPLSLINVLLAELGNRNKERISETFSNLERIWDDYGVYDKGDSEEDTRNEL
jgi:DNA-binding MurR/RpiR family transcriptional regulator